MKLATDVRARPRPRVPQPLDQQAFVLVLREDRADTGTGSYPAPIAEARRARLAARPDPEIDRSELPAALHHEVGDAELLVELEGPSLHGECSRGRAWLGDRIDDAHADTLAREAQREHEARGARRRAMSTCASR